VSPPWENDDAPEVTVDQNYNPNHYGTAQWNIIKQNLNRRKWGLPAVRVMDSVPSREVIESHAVRHHRRMLWVRFILATLAMLGIEWLISPLVLGITIALMITAVVLMLRHESRFSSSKSGR
jgi:Flp pilus assembly protein TadB